MKTTYKEREFSLRIDNGAHKRVRDHLIMSGFDGEVYIGDSLPTHIPGHRTHLGGTFYRRPTGEFIALQTYIIPRDMRLELKEKS